MSITVNVAVTAVIAIPVMVTIFISAIIHDIWKIATLKDDEAITLIMVIRVGIRAVMATTGIAATVTITPVMTMATIINIKYISGHFHH